MLGRFSSFVYRRRLPLLAIFASLFAAAAIYGAGASNTLQLGGLEDEQRESSRAMRLLKRKFGLGNPDVLFVVRNERPLAEDAEFRENIEALIDYLQRFSGILEVSSLHGERTDSLVSSDGRIVVVSVALDGNDSDKEMTFRDLEPEVRGSGLDVMVGGAIAAGVEVQHLVEQDLRRAELVTIPLLALLLLLFFRGVTAAVLPLSIGGFAIVAALALLRLLATVTEVSIFAMNVVSIIGLGVAVDYSLFMVRRFRDELEAGRTVEQATRETLRTAGRTVAFSGFAVAVSLLGLLVFPIMLLRSIALGGTLVVLMAMASSLVFLPAALAVLGRRIDWLSIAPRRRTAESPGFWHRLSTLVMRAPAAVAVGVTALLLLAGAPFLRLETSMSDLRNLFPDSEVRRVQDLLEMPGLFPPNELTPILIAVELDSNVVSRTGIRTLSAYVDRLEGLKGVRRVDSVASRQHRARLEDLAAAGFAALQKASPEDLRRLRRVVEGESTVVSVVADLSPTSPEAMRLVRQIRAIELDGGEALVGGFTAKQLDMRESMFEGLPLALLVICVATFVTLFLAFGSFVIPLKAIVMNALSISASFGALVWVFQDGRFEEVLRYTATGQIELTIPIVLFTVIFGLSMDYELFLLSRIREEYDRSGDSVQSVALGLERTARIITSAAALLVAVMAGLMTADLLMSKELALGMALAIMLDATIVRALLVPATMQLLGRLNWWAPAPLARLWRRLGLALDERAATDAG